MTRGTEVLAELTQEQFHFLEDFERRCNKSENTDVSKVLILRCLLRVFEEADIDINLNGVSSEDDLLHRFLDALKEAHR